jgi:hypothetical protein
MCVCPVCQGVSFMKTYYNDFKALKDNLNKKYGKALPAL